MEVSRWSAYGNIGSGEGSDLRMWDRGASLNDRSKEVGGGARVGREQEIGRSTTSFRQQVEEAFATLRQARVDSIEKGERSREGGDVCRFVGRREAACLI